MPLTRDEVRRRSEEKRAELARDLEGLVAELAALGAHEVCLRLRLGSGRGIPGDVVVDVAVIPSAEAPDYRRHSRLCFRTSSTESSRPAATSASAAASFWRR